MSALRFDPVEGKPAWGILASVTDKPRAAQFIPHNGFSKFRPARDMPRPKMDEFAELLSQGLTVAEAARRMGHDYNYGNAMLQRIRCRLGRQAR